MVKKSYQRKKVVGLGGFLSWKSNKGASGNYPYTLVTLPPPPLYPTPYTLPFTYTPTPLYPTPTLPQHPTLTLISPLPLPPTLHPYPTPHPITQSTTLSLIMVSARVPLYHSLSE